MGDTICQHNLQSDKLASSVKEMKVQWNPALRPPR